MTNLRRAVTEQEQAALLQAWNDGLRVSEIERRFDRSYDTIWRHLRRLGAKTRRPNFGKSGKDHPGWKGGRHVCEGYVRIVVSPADPHYNMTDLHGRVAEHRYVMAQHLGRDLSPGETVHHLNGIKTDNSIENLQLRHGNHGPGQRLRCRYCGSTDLEVLPL